MKNIFSSLLTLSMMLTVFVPTGSYAILSADSDALVNDSTYYIENDEDIAQNCASGSSTGNLGTNNDTTKAAGDAREAAIWKYLSTHSGYGINGLKPYQVAGIMGNMQVESANTWNPTVVEGVTYADAPISSKGYGIVQWSNPSTKIVDPIKGLNGKVNDLGSQLDLLWDQLFNPKSQLGENAAGDALKATTDVPSATAAFGLKFERYSGLAQQGRVDNANAILTKFGSGGGGGGDSGGGTTTCGASAVGLEGWAFPMQTTKTIIKKGSSGPGGTAIWCLTSQTNCHHDYNAADIHAPTGTVEVSITDGTIVFAHSNSLAIKSNNPKSSTQYVFWYGHMLGGSIKVKAGDVVKAGQPVGQTGTVADADGTAPHLHVDAEPAPPATTRPACKDAACAGSGFNFINLQPMLVAAYQGLPD